MSDYQPTPPTAAPYTAGVGQTSDRTNVLAIISLVLSLIGVGLGGVICGHIALSQIKRTGERGRGLALAGLIIGYVGILIAVVSTVLIVIATVVAAQQGGTTY